MAWVATSVARVLKVFMTQDLTIMFVPVFSTLCNAAFQLRKDVFVHEQGVPQSEEIDVDDFTASHLIAISAGEVVGVLRLVKKDEHIKIGRVAVRATARRRGIAKRLMLHAMESARTEGHKRFYLAAQLDKIDFYTRLGFTAFGEEFLDGGMPHRAMRNY
jgi:predicted GNAT family N-acyltransferase